MAARWDARMVQSFSWNPLRRPRSDEHNPAMAGPSRIQRRLALAIVLTALIPLLVAIYFSGMAIERASNQYYQPEVGQRLDQAQDLYRQLAKSAKTAMRYEAIAIASDPELRSAVQRRNWDLVQQALNKTRKGYQNVVSVQVVNTEDAEVVATTDRGRPLNPEKEFELTETLPVVAGAPYELVAKFAADKARFQGLEDMSAFVEYYRSIEQLRESETESIITRFAILLLITIIGAVGVGVLMARSVSSRIASLADATKQVGAGNLKIRVLERGKDEITDLASTFNRMVSEVEASRANIEYLQRIGAWQEMARRLAHEIKNPLTPIQLAVQEIHRRYPGDDPRYRQLLDTTLEIVEDEVGTLRRLVSEFSGFARLPQATLQEADLAEFLRDQERRIVMLEDEGDDEEAPVQGLLGSEKLTIEIPDGPAPAYIDRQMFRRALFNLIRNAAQAIAEQGRDERGQIRVRLSRDVDYWVLDIDDDGPGVPEKTRETIFDPYVTHKADGTGLGLAIVKKIIVEHGGFIAVDASDLGGARMRIRLPISGTAPARAALEVGASDPPSASMPSA